MKNKLNYYTGKDCMDRFCKGLKEHATEIINYEKKEMISLTGKESKSNKKKKVYYIYKKGFSTDDENKRYQSKKKKVYDHCHYTGEYRGAAHNICNLRYKTPK